MVAVLAGDSGGGASGDSSSEGGGAEETKEAEEESNDAISTSVDSGGDIGLWFHTVVHSRFHY